MKRSVLVVGILAIVMLSTADLMAQRNGRGSSGKDRGGGKYVKDRKRDDRGRNRGNDRQVRVVNQRTVSYEGYRENSYNRYGPVSYNNKRNNRKLRRPSNRHIWIAGNWQYNKRLRREIWHDGYWSVRRNNHKWVPAHYERFGGVRVWVAGCWITF